MNRFPYYAQLDAKDCGAACLRMIAKYYGRTYSAQSIREISQINKTGTSLLTISKAAEKIGFRTLGSKTIISKIIAESPLPCIIHWNHNHFVILYKIRKITVTRFVEKFTNYLKKVVHLILNTSDVNEKNTLFNHTDLHNYVFHIADPAKGLEKLNYKEFCASWMVEQTNSGPEGIVLLLEPTTAFFEQNDDKNTTTDEIKILSYFFEYKTYIAQIFIALSFTSLVQLIFPLLTQSIVDIGINTRNLSFINLLLLAQFMLTVGRLAVDFIRTRLVLHIGSRVNLSILSTFLMKLMSLPASYFDTKRYGDIIQRIEDHHRIETFLTRQALQIFFSIFTIIIFSVLVSLYSVKIFLTFTFLNILYLLWIYIFFKQRRNYDYKQFEFSSKNQSSLIQLIQGMQDIKLAGAEQSMRWKWEHIRISLFKLQLKTLNLNQFQTLGAFTINESKNILITFLSAKEVIEGNLTIGAMLALQQIIGQLSSPISSLVEFMQSFQEAKISLERMNEIHNQKSEEQLNTVSIINEINVIVFKNINFYYPGAEGVLALKNINFSIPKGKITAIVGTSGSGKTTLLKLLLKYYETTGGEILLNDLPLKNISPATWRAKCGAVMQDGFIFSDTIARNIAVNGDIIDEAKLLNAIKLANLKYFVDTLPLGYYTQIGNEGNGISQGQKQRILIARVLYKNPDFIFFDEATNALDADNELVIMTNLTKYFIGRTVIIVAHRLSTVKNADQIIVLDDGKIIELGNHKDLISIKGNYWKLIKNQLELDS